MSGSAQLLNVIVPDGSGAELATRLGALPGAGTVQWLSHGRAFERLERPAHVGLALRHQLVLFVFFDQRDDVADRPDAIREARRRSALSKRKLR